MYSECMMIAGLLLLVGMAMFYYTFLKVASGEGMALSVITVALTLYLAGLYTRFVTGIWVCGVLGAAGLLGYVFVCKRKRAFWSVSLVLTCVLFLGSTLAFHWAFIQNIDDLHQWAAAVRYMLVKDMLPVSGDFLGTASIPMYTSTFHLFFQLLGGYHEGNMYASAVLLSAAPLMLPLSGLSWKDWKKAVLYTGLIYLGFYSLYVHPYKSLYVDLPSAAWSAGLCLWWYQSSHEEERSLKRECIVLIPSLWFLTQIKWGVGLLLAAFFLGFMILNELEIIGFQKLFDVLKRYWKVICAVLVLGAAAMLLMYRWKGTSFIPLKLEGLMEALTFSSEKARLSAISLWEKTGTKVLNSASRWRVTTGPCVAVMTALFLLTSFLQEGRKRVLFLYAGIYGAVCFAAYMAVLYVTYVSTFSYDESITSAACHRYFSIIVLYLFIQLAGLSVLTYSGDARQKRGLQAILLCGCLFVCGGVNGKFLSRCSSLDNKNVGYYKDFTRMKKSLKKLNKLIGEDDRVYFLAQGMSLEKLNEIPLTVILYYETDRVSNYMRLPWKFYEGGCLRFVRNDDITIDEFPEILKEGEFTYIWIYQKDEYLEEQFEELFSQEELSDQGLYRIGFDPEGQPVSLEFVDKI